MFNYQKMLLFPVNIKKKDLKMAKCLVTQYGGPDGELEAALRYFNQSFTMPDERGKALLMDIATEELGHVEMINAMICDLTRGATIEEMKAAGLEGQYAQRGFDHYPTDNNGVPFQATFGSVGSTIANLYEDMAAEKKAKAVYEHLMDLTNDQDVIDVLIYLREREIVHFALFEALCKSYEESNNKDLQN